MYEFIQGELAQIQPLYLVISANGVGYRLLCANPYRWQGELHQQVLCPVELVVREDAMTLYGFRDHQEKQLFNTLLKVSGIGPKSALSILALDDHAGLIQAIDSGDSTYLTKFPGVGKKTAQQMILDLSGNLDFQAHAQTQASAPVSQQHLEEALEALAGLGYSAKEIKKVEKPLQEAGLTSTQEMLSAAFKLLRK